MGAFLQRILIAIGFSIISEPSKGQNTATDGYDLIVEEEHRREHFKWGVSCKHYAHSGASVNKDDEKAFTDMVTDNYTGLIAFYSTGVTSTLENNFSKIKKKQRKKNNSIRC